MGLRSCTRHTLPDHAATSIKLSEEPSAFETAWQPASSRVGPSPIRQRRPQAKAAGLFTAVVAEDELDAKVEARTEPIPAEVLERFDETPVGPGGV